MEGQTPSGPSQQDQSTYPTSPRKDNSNLWVIGGILAVIALLVVIVAIPMLGSADANKVKVVVSYSGSWSGTINAGGNVSTWSGQGGDSKVIDIPGGYDHFYIYTYAMKSDAGSGELKVSITTMDGRVLAQGSSSATFAVVQAGWQQ